MPQAFYIFAIAASLFSIVAKASVPDATSDSTKATENTQSPAVAVYANSTYKDDMTKAIADLIREHEMAASEYSITVQMKNGLLTVEKVAL